MRQPVKTPLGSGREFVGRRKDGTGFRVEVSLSPFSIDAATQVLCLITDIGDRMAAEKRIKIGEERHTVSAPHISGLAG